MKCFLCYSFALQLKLKANSITPQELQRVKDGFQSKQGFPNCCGALDVTHSNMELPAKKTHAHWYARDLNYSMTLQAMVDSNMRFLDIMCGMPGVCNDIRILRNSGLYMKAQNNTILNGPFIVRDQYTIREYILVDGGYLNLPWLVNPFPHLTLMSTPKGSTTNSPVPGLWLREPSAVSSRCGGTCINV
ncbi:hypothetical protein L7F22_054566 [Adiantum nelumboides]|nr:hypothetical protein [Adiantum nelumboides]